MDFIASPLLTVIINVVAQALVSRGILDVQSKDQFTQLARDGIVSLSTALIAIYSIYKMVDLHKHKISSTTVTPNSSVKTDESLPISQVGVQPKTVSISPLPRTQTVSN